MRLLIAEKRARVATRIDGINDFPEVLNEVNPHKIFPILIDKNLVCYGPALDELIHERYPAPTLLPVGPVKRAQVRMLASQVRGAYRRNSARRLEFINEIQDAYNEAGDAYMAGNAVSILDVAVLPLVYEMRRLVSFRGPFGTYYERMTIRSSFIQSLSPSDPPPVEESLDEEAA
jgi:glutathione S-transferase